MGIYATEANGALQEPNVGITVTGPDSAVTLTPSTMTLSPGGSATVGVSWSSIGFPNANVAVGGRPQGVSVSFGATSATSQSLTFSASSAAVNGKYTILLQVMSGVNMRTATLNVVIAPQPACTLATNPRIYRPASWQFGYAFGDLPSDSGHLQRTAQPGRYSGSTSSSRSVTGLTVQAPATLTAGSSASVTIASASTVKAGSYQLQVTASGSGFTKTITVP